MMYLLDVLVRLDFSIALFHRELELRPPLLELKHLFRLFPNDDSAAPRDKKRGAEGTAVKTLGKKKRRGGGGGDGRYRHERTTPTHTQRCIHMHSDASLTFPSSLLHCRSVLHEFFETRDLELELVVLHHKTFLLARHPFHLRDTTHMHICIRNNT
jgi:hypothetical protein